VEGGILLPKCNFEEKNSTIKEASSPFKKEASQTLKKVKRPHAKKDVHLQVP